MAEPFAFSPEFYCEQCRTPFLNRAPLNEDGLCALCRLGITAFSSCYCFGEYDGTLRHLIHLFKYQGLEPLARPLGRLMATALPRDERFDLISPVPLHWWKRFQRGFNQSLLLAEEVSRRTGIPVRTVLRRRRNTKVQAGLTHAMRRLNVRGVFAATDKVEGARVLLLDDVLTTGATANACARVLRDAGAHRVAVLTLARVDRRMAVPAGRPADVHPYSMAGARG